MARLLLLALTALAVDATFHMPSPYSWRCVQKSLNEEPVCVKQRKSAVKDTGVSHATCVLTCGTYGALWPKPSIVTLGKEVKYTLPQNIEFQWNRVPLQEEEQLIRGVVDRFKGILLRMHPEYENFKDTFGYDDFSGNYSGDETTQVEQQRRQNNRRARHEISASKFYHYHSQKGQQDDNEPLKRFYSGRRFFDSQSKEIRPMIVDLRIKAPSHIHLHLNTSEKYDLEVTEINNQIVARISGETFFGMRHGLETLSQLMDYDEYTDSIQIVTSTKVQDQPAYPYRGLIVDTSRNFMSIEALERTLCAMASSKLNTFHWHITDSNSFPMYLNSLPKMSYYGAHTYNQIYYPEDIQHIVNYGRIRGIRVLPELDAPAHVGNGWEWGPEDKLGNLAVCVNQEPWQKYCVQPPCGQLNIANPNIYPVLHKIYKEMIKNFGPLDLFHYGGDEVNVNCWNSTHEIANWMQQKGNALTEQDYFAEWSNFQNKAYEQFTRANGGQEIPGILWTSHLTEKGHTDRYLDRNKYIVQIWSNQTDPLIQEILSKNYRVIFSNYDTMYLDCGFGNWVDDGNNWCAPFKEWQKLYDSGPRSIAEAVSGGAYNRSLLLGGEAALWSEKVDDSNLDSRVWPRAAAMAERLWSDPGHDWKRAELRLVNHRQRLVKRGVRADRLQPQWCHQNQGLCYFNSNAN